MDTQTLVMDTQTQIMGTQTQITDTQCGKTTRSAIGGAQVGNYCVFVIISALEGRLSQLRN